MGVNFYEEIRSLLILCSFPESWNDLVMAMSNFVSESNTLKLYDVIGFILSDEIHRKTSYGFTSESDLNAKSRGKMIGRGNNSIIHGKSREKSKGKRS